jgi:hypothetical protein
MGWPKGKPRNKPSWNAGLRKDNNEVVRKSAQKISESMIGKSFITDEGRKALSKSVSENMKARYASGWVNRGGRCKKIEYDSPIAGKVYLDGTWEEKVAKHFDSIGVNWERNKRRFQYVRPDGKISTYCPDFYVADWHTFVEVKGFETELDRIKWSQFPNTLEIWKHDKIKELGRVREMA